MTDCVDRYQAYGEALRRNPDDAGNLVNQFSLLSEQGELANANLYLYLARRAYLNDPNEISACFNYGSALARAGDFEESLFIFQRCEKIAPNDDWKAKSWHHIGIANRSLSNNEKAIEWYDRAIAATGKASIKKDRAIALMASGRLRDGLEAFECRRELAEERLKINGGKLIAQQKLPAGVVHWQGEDLKGKSVVVYHEEGVGDFIMLARFLPKLYEAGAKKVYLTGPIPNLLEMLSDSIKVDGIVPLEGPFDCDYVTGSMSFPWRLGLDYKDVKGKSYLHSKRADIPKRGKMQVGLVWRGNPDYGMDVHRSMAFSEFAPLFDLKDIAFCSLQYGGSANEVMKLGFAGFVPDYGANVKSWRDTAAVVSALDAVVSVDTSVAHLAGALGIPVHILITRASDWRWDRNSEKTVWYDSATVIRQSKQGDWNPCILRVREKLEAMLAERRREAA